MKMAWLSMGLLISAEIVDDVFQQPYSGYRYLPGRSFEYPGWIRQRRVEPERTSFANGQYHFTVSREFFEGQQAGDFLYKPENIPAEGRRLALRFGRITAIAWKPISVCAFGTG